MELFWAIAALAVGLGPLVVGARQGIDRRLRWVALGLGAATVAALALAQARRAPAEGPRVDRPNQLPAEGFATSGRCRACHPAEYTSWHASFHRTMTQIATPESVKGDFSGQTLKIYDQEWRLEQREGAPWVRWEGPDAEAIARSKMIIGALEQNISGGGLPKHVLAAMVRDREAELRALKALEVARVVHERPIVQVTGSHHYQVYWYPSTLDRRSNRVETINKGLYNLKWTPDSLQGELLPFRFVYLLDDRRWVPRDAVFVHPSDPRPFGPWNNNCLKCHTTQGRPRPDHEAAKMASEVVEFGIACESCHGPAGEHGRANAQPLRRYGLYLSGEADGTVAQPERFDHKRSSQICGQCHSVSNYVDPKGFLEHGSTFRPGEALEAVKRVVWPRGGQEASKEEVREGEWNPQAELDQSFWSDGVVRILGREYNGLLDSACHAKGEMACTSCHSMHDSDPDDQLIEGMDGDKACLKCHADHAGKIEAHTHHAVGSAGSACMNCHMPYTAFGLLKAARNHTIEIPSAEVSARVGRPNACNQCHLDKTLAWSAELLTRWYGAPAVELEATHREVSASLVWLIKGDAAQRVLMAWSMGWSEARRASGGAWMVPFLIDALDDSYDAIRLVAERSLRKHPGFEELGGYDFMAESKVRRASMEALRGRWRSSGGASSRSMSMSEVLIGAKGEVMGGRVESLRSQRDDRPVILAE